MLSRKRENWIALFVCAVACCAWSWVIDWQYYHLAYFSWDLPLYANLMWNLCHGSVQTSLFGGNFLIDHFNAIAFLLVPFYFFCQSALTILYFKLIAFFAGAYIFYILTSKRMGGLWGIAFLLVYIFYPSNVAMIFFEFNFENLAIPLIFLIFYFFEEKKYVGFILTCILLTLVKENMPLIVLMFGVYGFWVRREEWFRWGLCPLLLGAGMFFLEVFILIPWLRHGLGASNAHWGLYGRLGHSPQEIIHTLIFNQSVVFKILFNEHNLLFLLKLFGPLLIAALLAPGILLLATPVFLQDLLSKNASQQDINTFYSSILTVFIFMAAVDCLSRLKAPFRKYFLSIVIVLLFIFDLSFVRQWHERIIPYQEKQAVNQQIISQIPADAKVIASYNFLYLIAQRKDLYVLFSIHKKFSVQKVVLPAGLDYMAVDFSTRVDNKDVLVRFLENGRWKIQDAANEALLLRKNLPQGEVLINSSDHPLGLGRHFNALSIGGGVDLQGVSVSSVLRSGQRKMRVVFYWHAIRNEKNTNLPSILLRITQGGKTVYVKESPAFYGLPFTKNKYYSQVFYYFIPVLSRGNYQVTISATSSDQQDPRVKLPVDTLRIF